MSLIVRVSQLEKENRNLMHLLREARQAIFFLDEMDSCLELLLEIDKALRRQKVRLENE